MKRLLLMLYLVVSAVVAPAQAPPVVDTIIKEEEVLDEWEETEEDLSSGPGFYNAKTDVVIHPKKLADSSWYAQKQMTDGWYDPEEKFQESARRSSSGNLFDFLNSKMFRALAWTVVIVGILVILVFFLKNSNIYLFSGRGKKIGRNDDDILEPDSILEIDFDKHIKAAVANNDYRQAVRLHFLKLLKLLDQHRLIIYQKDRTNLEYYFQLQKTSVAEPFATISRYYEYAWYGKADVNEQQYLHIKTQAQQFEQKLT